MSTATSDSRNTRKTIIGFVTSRSGDKSIKVTIPYKTPHPLYHKVINRKTVVHAHDEKNETKVGDKVRDHGDAPDQPPQALARRLGRRERGRHDRPEAISETDVAATVPTKTTRSRRRQPAAGNRLRRAHARHRTHLQSPP